RQTIQKRHMQQAMHDIIIPLISALHFYIVHRLLHVPFLYRLAHALHHRNVVTGPWSGISMHPVEHVFYLSAVLVHFVIPSHPVHVLFHFYWLTLGAAGTHCGFKAIVIGGREWFSLGSFYHQLHHRHFECNYGNIEFPVDHWVGSSDDGTYGARKRLASRKPA
ncbi:MAG: sterol desaturase family protein, partial [Pseudomonadota bacterium]